MKTLRAEDITKNYGSGRLEVKALRGINFHIDPGEIVLIMGPSGSGKTTFLSLLGGLLKPTSGKVFLDDTEMSALSEKRLPQIRLKNIGFIFQSFNIISSLTVLENVSLMSRLLGRRNGSDRAVELLKRLGMEDRMHFLPHKLSGGEQQRVAIARALMNNPRVVLADEPTGNLDSKNGHEVMMILHDIAKEEGKSVVVVSHDTRLEDISDRILWLEDGELKDKKTVTASYVRDPVCGMQIDKLATKFKHTHQGADYFFCSEKCLKKFRENPQLFFLS